MVDKQLLSLIGSNRRYISYTVALMLLGLVSNIGITASVCYAIHLLTISAHPIQYMYPFCGSALFIIVRYICSRLVADLKDRLGRSVKKDLRACVYRKIVRLGVRSTDDMNTAGLTQIAIEGIEQLDLYYSSYIPQFFFALFAPVVLFFVAVFMEWRVALVLLACVPLIPVSIVAVVRYAKKIFAKYWGKYTAMGDFFLDSVQGLKELKIFKADGRYHKKMDDRSEEFRNITMKVLTMQLLSITIMDLVAYCGAGIGTSVALWSAISGDISPTSALFLILVAVDFFLPLRAFGSAFHVSMNGVSAGKKIAALLETPDPIWGNTEATNYRISFENVTFSYDGERNILKNISAVFEECGMTAIVGASGCGKSTIVDILLGVYRPTAGAVTIGGQPLTNISRESHHKAIAVVSYNTYIFHQSVRENFRLVNPSATDDEIYKALKAVNLYDFLMQNGGLDKVIAESASNISGGQRQRLALAIALVADKAIYIFDEATSNIDVESETIIMQNIQKLSNTKSVIVISHRLANVVSADNIYYVENGEMRESGSHQALLCRGGGYAKLYFAQKSLEQGYRG